MYSTKSGRFAPQAPDAFKDMILAGMDNGSITFTNGKDATDIIIPQYKEAFLRLIHGPRRAASVFLVRLGRC